MTTDPVPVWICFDIHGGFANGSETWCRFHDLRGAFDGRFSGHGELCGQRLLVDFTGEVESVWLCDTHNNDPTHIGDRWTPECALFEWLATPKTKLGAKP